MALPRNVAPPDPMRWGSKFRGHRIGPGLMELHSLWEPSSANLTTAQAAQTLLYYSKGPCTTIVPKYLDRDCFKARVYTIWVHEPLGFKV